MQANRRIFWLATCLALTLALALVVPTHAGLGAADPSPTVARTLADKPKSRTHDVDITGKGFSPNRLTLKAGDSVSWTNTDSRDHTVTGPGFGSGNIKPGGRFYCDNVDLASPAGWAVFEESRLRFKPSERPSQISKCSTQPEIETFLRRAGFDNVKVAGRLDFWAYGWGTKPWL